MTENFKAENPFYMLFICLVFHVLMFAFPLVVIFQFVCSPPFSIPLWIFHLKFPLVFCCKLFLSIFRHFFPAPVSFNYICLGKKNLISTRNFFFFLSIFFFLEIVFQLFKDKKFRFSSVGLGLWNSFFSWVNNVIYFCFKICFVA